MLAGMCIGFATATKFSAMPLFLPLGVAALHRYVVERRFLSVASRCALAVVVAVAAFALAQPYALIDFKTFYHDVFEQSTMVRNAGVVSVHHAVHAHAEVRLRPHAAGAVGHGAGCWASWRCGQR